MSYSYNPITGNLDMVGTGATTIAGLMDVDLSTLPTNFAPLVLDPNDNKWKGLSNVTNLTVDNDFRAGLIKPQSVNADLILGNDTAATGTAGSIYLLATVASDTGVSGGDVLLSPGYNGTDATRGRIRFRDGLSSLIASLDLSTLTDDRTITVPDSNGTLSLQVTAPTSATDPGKPGQTAYDDDYFYICTATDTWKRVGIATW